MESVVSSPIANFIYTHISFISNGFFIWGDGFYTILCKQSLEKGAIVEQKTTTGILGDLLCCGGAIQDNL